MSSWIAAASTTPTSTEMKPSTCGLTDRPLMSATLGSTVNEAAATRTSETTAEVKKPRLIGARPLRSALPGLLARMPTTEATTPIAATVSGKTIPVAPNKSTFIETLPKMR